MRFVLNTSFSLDLAELNFIIDALELYMIVLM